jgi:hypothetical protein
MCYEKWLLVSLVVFVSTCCHAFTCCSSIAQTSFRIVPLLYTLDFMLPPHHCLLEYPNRKLIRHSLIPSYIRM